MYGDILHCYHFLYLLHEAQALVPQPGRILDVLIHGES